MSSVRRAHLTLVHPAIGHRAGESYIRSWQMESLPIAVLTALTPPDIELAFYDDRLETIPFDAPTDAVAIPVETYTAARAYQIASEYRRRGVPVVMGGFHATLMTNEVARHAEAVVTGEAEAIWPEVIDDLRHRRLKPRYHGERQPLSAVRVDRRLFAGKRYLPIGLIDTGRGCKFPCEVCAIQAFFSRTYRSRPVDDVVRELASLKDEKRLFFFVDDNFAGDMKAGRELLPALAKLKVRWITQMSINAAHDEAYLQAMREAGCVGVLIGFESLDDGGVTGDPEPRREILEGVADGRSVLGGSGFRAAGKHKCRKRKPGGVERLHLSALPCPGVLARVLSALSY